MKIKKYVKNIIGAALATAALVSGSAGASTWTTYTGSVAWFSTNDDGYTFVNVLDIDGYNKIAYYTGTNSAIATVIDNASRLNQDVTVVVTTGTNQIFQVR